MKTNVFLIIGSILFLASCSARLTSSMQKTYAPLDYREEVRVLGIGEEVPSGAEKIGTIKVGDSGFSTKCNYKDVLDKATIEARKVGGNTLKITTHKLPDAWTSCHRITADVLKVDDIKNYMSVAQVATVDTALMSTNYAIINVYRPSGPGVMLNYDLYLGDSVICRVANNSCESIRIYKNGYSSLWAKTEAKEEIPINVEFGKTYYVRCGVGIGLLVGRPTIQMIDNYTGEFQFNAIQQKKNK